jgi:hypothetical protein
LDDEELFREDRESLVSERFVKSLERFAKKKQKKGVEKLADSISDDIKSAQSAS